MKGFLSHGVPGGENSSANREHAEMVKAAADGIAAWIDPKASVPDEDLEASLHLLRHLAQY